MLGCSKGILSAVLCHEGKRITYPHISVASSVTTLTPYPNHLDYGKKILKNGERFDFELSGHWMGL